MIVHVLLSPFARRILHEAVQSHHHTLAIYPQVFNSLTTYSPGESIFGTAFVTCHVHINKGNCAAVFVFQLSFITVFMIVSVGGAVQVGTVMTFESVVIVPQNDSALHSRFVLAPMVIPAVSIVVPKNVLVAASVVAPPGVRHTSHTDAPFDTETTDPTTVVSAPVILKIKVEFPLNVIPAAPIEAAPSIQYTPHVYTPIGPCVISVARSIGPGAKVNVHACPFNDANAAF